MFSLWGLLLICSTLLLSSLRSVISVLTATSPLISVEEAAAVIEGCSVHPIFGANRSTNKMAEAQADSKETGFIGTETETFDTRGKAAIPLDYSVGGHGVDVNMEAPISTEDLIRAGGLGARDDIGGAMPSTVDATDYEESLMAARDYEGIAEDAESARPGLGASPMVPSEDPHGEMELM